MNGSRPTKTISRCLSFRAHRLWLAMLAASFLFSAAGAVAAELNAEANEAAEARLETAVKFLASDELQGRGMDSENSSNKEGCSAVHHHGG